MKKLIDKNGDIWYVGFEYYTRDYDLMIWISQLLLIQSRDGSDSNKNFKWYHSKREKADV